jgi:hypothetical protein
MLYVNYAGGGGGFVNPLKLPANRGVTSFLARVD